MDAQVWLKAADGTATQLAAVVDFKIAARVANDLSKLSPYNAGRTIAVCGTKVWEYLKGQKLVVCSR